MASWLFGSRNTPQDFSQFVPPAEGGGAGGDDDKDKDKLGHKMDAYRFDSTALERAAKAAKDLEKSAYAQQVLELTKAQEQAKQNEWVSKSKELELQIEHTKADSKRADAEERRRLLQEQAKLDQQKSQYQDQLARKRYDDQLLQQQRMNEENLRRQEESTAKQEAMRKATIEYEMESRNKHDIKRQEAKILTQGKLDRENQDLKLEQMKLQAEEDRETLLKSLKEKKEIILSSITTASSAIGTGLSTFLSDPNKIAAAVGGAVALTTGYFATKGSLGLMFKFIEARMVRPKLVTETSRIVPIDVIKHPIQSAKKLYRKGQDVLAGVVLEPDLEKRLRAIAIGTKNTKFNKGMFRNILLHGPPGTGKTLFAKKLAMHSGMDYAILTGADVAMMGKESVGAIHKVFDWANTSRRGLILFIDEAEAFLQKRHKEISEDLRMPLNAFLYRTGTQTDKFMLVLASNTPEVLDMAIADRVHEPIFFPLPNLDERRRLAHLYFEKYILTPASKGKRRLKIQNFNYSEGCLEIARITEGLSAREIANLALDWQMTTYVSIDGVFTKDIMVERAQAAVRNKQHKISWYSTEELLKSNFSEAVITAVRKHNQELEEKAAQTFVTPGSGSSKT